MNREIQTKPNDKESNSSNPEGGSELNEDTEFKGVKLGRRQPDAYQEIVCEGGCE